MKSNLKNSKIKIRTKINQTEDPKKVENTIKNLTTTNIILNKEDNYIYTEGDIGLLNKIKKLIKSNEFYDVALNVFNKNKKRDNLTFFVNKQSMHNNKFHMVDENMSALDDIEVSIDSSDIDGVIGWILE